MSEKSERASKLFSLFVPIFPAFFFSTAQASQRHKRTGKPVWPLPVGQPLTFSERNGLAEAIRPQGGPRSQSCDRASPTGFRWASRRSADLLQFLQEERCLAGDLSAAPRTAAIQSGRRGEQSGGSRAKPLTPWPLTFSPQCVISAAGERREGTER